MAQNEIRYNPWEGTITFDMPPRFSGTAAYVHAQSRIIDGEIVETTYLLEEYNDERNEEAKEVIEREAR